MENYSVRPIGYIRSELANIDEAPTSITTPSRPTAALAKFHTYREQAAGRPLHLAGSVSGLARPKFTLGG